jgi:DNA-binding transcriptional LysR family regulator
MEQSTMAVDLDDIQLFDEVARAGSLTAAARALGVPKSTVSRRLARHEEQLGAKLFNKTTRRIVLTEFGESYLERCAGVAREVAETRAFLEAATRRPSGVLRVTMPVDVGIHWLAGFLADFAVRHPDVSLAIDLNARRVDLVGERVDVAIRVGRLDDSNLVARKFLVVERALYASPDYLATRGTPARVADLADHRFLLLEGQIRPVPVIRLTRGRMSSEVRMHGPIVVNSMGMMRALAAAGAGIAALPRRMADEEVGPGRLVRVLREWAPPPIDCYWVVAARKLLPAKTRLFVEALQRHFGPSAKPDSQVPPARRPAKTSPTLRDIAPAR